MPRQYTPELRQADQQRLIGVHPDLVAAILCILDAMAAYWFPMFVTEGVRTVERQQALWEKGRERQPEGTWKIIGPVVTYADGILKPSNHQRKEDGLGHAVDCAFLDDPSTANVETWDPAQPWEVYGLMGEYRKLRWLGRGPRLIDRPHLELP